MGRRLQYMSLYLMPTLVPCCRHEMPTDPNDPLSNQKLKEGYYGTEDPVADKLMKQASDMPQLTAPDHRTVTSLYVGGVEDDITEKDLRSVWCQLCVQQPWKIDL